MLHRRKEKGLTEVKMSVSETSSESLQHPHHYHHGKPDGRSHRHRTAATDSRRQ